MTAEPRSADDLATPAIELVGEWLQRHAHVETRQDRKTMERLRRLIVDEAGVSFVMGFVDRVARPQDNRVAANQLDSLVSASKLPDFLSSVDKLMLSAGAPLGRLLPDIVIPLARRRMRSIVGHLVAPAELDGLKAHLVTQRSSGYRSNINLLGEAVLGETEADARLKRLLELLNLADIDYVSVKISAVASQLNHWAFVDSLNRVTERVAVLVDAAANADTPVFVNFDMEEYHDLELTVEAFKNVLGASDREHLDAGIVLQTYLPDVFEVLGDLCEWAQVRHRNGGGTIKIRLVKGANLAMEKVDAAMHGWQQAPYETKAETDANFKRCLDWVLRSENLIGVRIGVASHNLFDVAWAKLLADERGVAQSVQFEMLQGMAPAHAKAVNESTPGEMLLYTPAVAADDFDVAIGYLFRRLEENSAKDNFLRSLFELEPDSDEFNQEAAAFKDAMRLRHDLASGPARSQKRVDFSASLDRPGGRPATSVAPKLDPWSVGQAFRNEPDTDPTLASNRDWVARVRLAPFTPCKEPLTTHTNELRTKMVTAKRAALEWRRTSLVERRRVLHRVGDELSLRRSELINAMMFEASKVFSEADSEVSEAIDFARWYAERVGELMGTHNESPAKSDKGVDGAKPDVAASSINGAVFEPLGVIGVVPPWNFPVAIPAGGVLASLAAGNSVMFKPSLATPRCAEIVAEACWAAGVGDDVLQFVRTLDDEVGRHLVESVDGVILTGSSETADLFAAWKPGMRLFAETSGKNALIVTPNADLDLAAADLAASAFGHAGQKCSAASLAILVGDVYDNERFRRQLVDAVKSLRLGIASDLSTDIAPLLDGLNDRLRKAVETLEPGQTWLVRPEADGDLVSPGVLDGVEPGSWFHTTECFGPVLGLVSARTFDEAINIANSSEYGLTGGIHTLDWSEVEKWAERIEVGNGYVNRPITGAVVQRQPFGGWKKSSRGPGAKAGGLNYVMQLGTWNTAPHPVNGGGVTRDSQGGANDTQQRSDDYDEQWQKHFSVDHDETGLFCEANIFRYRPLSKIGLRTSASANDLELALVRKAAALAGVELLTSTTETESDEDCIQRMSSAGIDRVRVVGVTTPPEFHAAAYDAGIHVAADPVTSAGRVELQNYVREQAMSVTLHRFGNLGTLQRSLEFRGRNSQDDKG